MIFPSFLVLEPDLEPRNLPPAGSFRICSALPSAVRRLLLLGPKFWAFFWISSSMPPALPPCSFGFCLQILVPDRSVS
ncbi:hypothetical protein SLEP1_g24328 [Rubroshorea leprosula]|uniref:Uncharacterized protein n=1 Tax=Rubroshorea leprosula TaxID=152421 RepID=A0AAV5JFA9_9ROSI|nr:hypothetical protein SLEP1_g24328 [Rubroshorea leprosula]